MPDVREVTYDLLRRHGLTTVFGNPGSNELPFLAGMPDDFRYILGLHEGAVLAMADGYAQARGSSAFVNLHAAAGTGNALGTLTNSAHSHSPLVIMAGQQVRSTIGQEVLLAGTDAPQLPKPLVKWSCEPACAQDVPRSVSQAVHTANLPAKGPVFISVPYDDWEQEAPPEAGHLLERTTASAGALDAGALSAVAEALDGARSPALVLGPEVDAVHAGADAVRLADRLAAPVWIAPSASRCPFPTRHPSFRGVLPAAVRGVTDALEGHDVVLVAGAPVFRYHQFVPGSYLPEGTRLLHLTSDPAEAARAPMGEALVADVGKALKQLAGAVTGGRRSPLPPLPDFPAPRTAPGGQGVHPEELFALLRQHAPEDAVYVKESTATTGAFWTQMDLSQQGSYFFPAAGGLGFGLPAAVGAQLAHRERQVIGLIGDGSANYGITALWTAAQYRIPVIVVILKNGTYGALRWFSRILGAEGTPGMDVPGIDFTALARGYGVHAVAVRTAGEFAAALTGSLGRDEPVVIEVETVLTEP